MRVRNLLAVMAAAGTAALLGVTALAPAAGAVSHGGGSDQLQHPSQIRHVLLISVDGMHQQDLAWYVRTYPQSVLAGLVGHGIEYNHAETTIPSDSFPATVGLMTGGSPGVTGFYYDDTYNYDAFPAGTKKCAGPPPGGQVNYDNSIDVNTNGLDAGEGLRHLPGSILQMTSNLRSLINPASLPVSAATCTPIYPNQYLKVNTIFNVVHNAGLRTAWSDKHPSYLVLSGPSGNGVDDFFAPEIDSQAIGYPAGEAWTDDVAATIKFDSYRVQAVLNEIDGYNHSRTSRVGVPGLFGMNFQTVTTALQLPSSDGLNRSQAAANFVKQYLLTHTAVAYNIHGKRVTVSASGLSQVYAGAASAAYFGVPNSDPRHPVIFGIVQYGVVYADAPDIAQHGGAVFQDLSIPILVVLPGLHHGTTVASQVKITQIAPTILALLGLNPRTLQAVQIEHTQVLPSLH